eukprot:357381-Chlamydomonas_euryale.AAC.11
MSLSMSNVRELSAPQPQTLLKVSATTWQKLTHSPTAGAIASHNVALYKECQFSSKATATLPGSILEGTSILFESNENVLWQHCGSLAWQQRRHPHPDVAHMLPGSNDDTHTLT